MGRNPEEISGEQYHKYFLKESFWQIGSADLIAGISSAG
jgi:hypothetical protein